MQEFDGLSSNDAKALLEKHGPNVLPEKPPPSSFQILIEQLKSPLVYVLIAAGIITFFLKEYADTVVIGAAVTLNTVLGFVQEKRASNALQALKELIHPQAKVMRDGQEVEIGVELVVPGDVAILNNGEKIPADGVLIQASHFYAEEAVLTGESVPISKKTGEKVFMGTIATGGRAYMRVESTGHKTEIGKIATSIQEEKSDTPLKKQLAKFSKQLTIVVVFLTAFVFVVGFLSGRDLAEVFITSVALAVSAIPEGLLVMLTVVLAIGMQRTLARKGLVRNLVSAETLGGVTTICTDKTGTLTEGKMNVSEAVGSEDDLRLQAVLTNNHDDPIVIAAWNWAAKKVKNPKSRIGKYPRLDELPFSPQDRFSATLHKFERSNKVLVNGAPEYLLKWCDLPANKKSQILKEIEDFSQKGMRLMGMAEKTVKSSKSKLQREDITKGKLKWKGLLVFSDPVRKGVGSAIKKTQTAGIRLIVITGDYKKTALSVLEELGVNVKPEFVIEGENLRKMSQSDLKKLLKGKETILFARTTPQEKLKIIESLKDNGEVVAMTGDGVNDAPALAKSDIGIVVDTATDVAKESSDLVLLDSSFATIVSSIEEGRVIFDNIRKILLNLMSDAFEEIVAVLGTIILGATLIPGLPLPVSAAQILYINLVSDGFPNLALTVDPKRPGIMDENPRDPHEQLATGWVRSLIAITSITGGVVALFLFVHTFLDSGDIVRARSVAFATLGVNSLLYVFSIRTLLRPFWTVSIFNNKWLIVSVIAGLIIQILPFAVKPLGEFFDVMPLTAVEWIEVVAAAIVMVTLIEVFKAVYRRNVNINHA